MTKIFADDLNYDTQGDDEDVASKLYDMCRAEEKKLRGESESEEESDQDEYIPEDDEDEGPCVQCLTLQMCALCT